MPAKSNSLIIGFDLGKTNLRAALAEVNLKSPRDLRVLFTAAQPLANHASLDDLSGCMFRLLGVKPRNVAQQVWCGAGVYSDGRLRVEPDYRYPITLSETAKKQHWRRYAVMHDYAGPAASVCIPGYLKQNEICVLRLGEMLPYRRRVAWGSGSGVGLKDSFVLRNGGLKLGANEASHLGIPDLTACLPEHLEIIKNGVTRGGFVLSSGKIDEEYVSEAVDLHQRVCDVLQRKPGLLNGQTRTLERLISGPGLTLLMKILTGFDKTPEEIGPAIQSGRFGEIANAFSFYLGLFQGTVEVQFMPAGGCFITGGVILKNPSLVKSPFFEIGRRMTLSYLKERDSFPMMVLTEDAPTLGALYLAMLEFAAHNKTMWRPDVGHYESV